MKWWHLAGSQDDDSIKKEWPIASFKTAFENASPEELQQHFEELVARQDRSDRYEFERSMFVVLDSRSAEDSTCVFYFHNKHMPEDDDSVRRWDESKVIRNWMSWRFRFQDLQEFIGAFEKCRDEMVDGMKGPDPFAYTDKNGVSYWPGKSVD